VAYVVLSSGELKTGLLSSGDELLLSRKCILCWHEILPSVFSLSESAASSIELFNYRQVHRRQYRLATCTSGGS